MYIGLTLAYLGEMGILVEIAPLIPLLFVVAYVNWILIPVEEAKLRAVFRRRLRNTANVLVAGFNRLRRRDATIDSYPH